MDIKRENDIYVIQDSEKNIDCIYDGKKLAGKGSRLHKDSIISEIEAYKLVHTLEKASEIYNASDDDYKELASLNFIIESLGGNVTTNTVTFSQIKAWQANPVKYANEIYKYSKYLYGSTGIVTQTMNLFTSLHGLTSSLKKTNPNEIVPEDEEKIKRYDSYINKETVLRDILKEVVHGTAIGYIYRKRWVQMLDIEIYVPKRIVDGYWQVECDLLQLVTADSNKNMYDYPNEYQEYYTPNLELITRQPEEIRRAFKKWQMGKGERRYMIAVEKTIVIKLNGTQQERYGRSLAMGAFDDLLHKNLIRQAEEVLLDKVVNQIITLTMGEKGKESDGNFKPTPSQRTSVGQSVKKILNKTTTDDSTKDKDAFKVVGLPWWAKLEAVAVDLDLFKSKKYDEINKDILQSLGVGDIFGASENGSYASASVSIELFFKDIFVVLEQIEDQLFDRQYAIMSSNRNNIYTRRFSRGTVIGEKKIEVLKNLFDIGGSVKYLLDEIGEDYDEYIEQVKNEKTEGLHELFEPYRTSSTLGNEGGRPEESGSGDNSSNSNPKPSTS